MARLAWLWPIFAIMLAAKWGARMRDWGFWEWVAYATIWVGALIIAADAGLKLTKGSLRETAAPLLESPVWAFLPLICIILGTLILGSRELGLLGERAARQNKGVVAVGLTSKPELRLILLGANVFVPDEAPTLTGIGLDARVWNTGVPSVAVAWSLTILPKGQTPVVAQYTTMPPEIRAGGEFNSAVLRASDSLGIKTLKEPIQSTPIDGVLLFYVALPKSVVENGDTWWELSVTDMYGVESTTRKKMAEWLSR